MRSAKTNCNIATNGCSPDQACGQGGARAVRKDGGEDAQEARRACEEEREAQQDVEILSQLYDNDRGTVFTQPLSGT
jgi:hypothetical protein